MTEKKIICLANSRKLGGWCVAGRELTDKSDGKWIRPVSGRGNPSLYEKEKRYQGGGEPDVLDIVKIRFMEAMPDGHQKENWQINPGYPWRNTGRSNWDDLQGLIESPEDQLWVDGYQKHPQNDRIAEEELRSVRRSLYLIKPGKILLRVRRKPRNNQEQLRARFWLGGHEFYLSVTDPWAERKYSARNYPAITKEEITAPDDTLLCISLGGVSEYEGYKTQYAFKLVATIITRERVEKGK